MVKIGSRLMKLIILSTGTPQGCGLSPLGYRLFTHDCKVEDTSTCSVIVKFADDTTLSGLISNGSESGFLHQVASLGKWSDMNNLVLNVDKTKEMIIDFRKTEVKLNKLPLMEK
jgi:hypothetical protein